MKRAFGVRLLSRERLVEDTRNYTTTATHRYDDDDDDDEAEEDDDVVHCASGGGGRERRRLYIMRAACTLCGGEKAEKWISHADRAPGALTTYCAGRR